MIKYRILSIKQCHFSSCNSLSFYSYNHHKRDGHPFSFIISLNEKERDFEGGGTRFYGEGNNHNGDETEDIRPKKGDAVGFCGWRAHEGQFSSFNNCMCEYY